MNTARSNARRAALQALYQWQMAGQQLDAIERQFFDDDWLKDAQKSYFKELLHGVPEHLEAIDSALEQFIDRPLADIDPVEKAVLRIGAYELLYRQDLPYRVVLNESINLAKAFGADGSYKYVNGILDKIAQRQPSAQQPHQPRR